VVEAVRQKADTYIYTNPLSVADCAAAAMGNATERRAEPAHAPQEMTVRFRRGIDRLGGSHRAAPDRAPARARHPAHPPPGRPPFDSGILAVGLTFPVVPRGTTCFQVNAAHTAADIDLVLEALARFR
jgi:glycine C-acetyltransferase